jgi:hypothetical protein
VGAPRCPVCFSALGTAAVVLLMHAKYAQAGALRDETAAEQGSGTGEARVHNISGDKLSRQVTHAQPKDEKRVRTRTNTDMQPNNCIFDKC